MIRALFEYQFLRHALLAAVLVSIICGLIGVIVVEKRLLMMSGGIAHTAYGGVGLGYLLGFEPILGAFLFAILAALGIGRIRRRGFASAETVISLFWSLGMALGVLFIGLMPGYPPALNSYLFGNILAVTRADLILTAVLTGVVLGLILVFFQHWKAFLFDDTFAAILGLPTAWLSYILLVLVAMTVVALIRVVGIILLLAMLAAPAAIASMFKISLAKRMLLSTGVGLGISLAGLGLSYTLNLPSGAVMATLGALSFFLVRLVMTMLFRQKRKTGASDAPRRQDAERMR